MQTVIKDADGKIINIGPWDYRLVLVTEDDLDRPIHDEAGVVIGYEQKQVESALNPLPAGAYEDQAEVVEGLDGGMYAKSDYRALRRDAYPAIGDQLDALYKAGLFPPEMAAQIAAVKAKYPKSGG